MSRHREKAAYQLSLCDEVSHRYLQKLSPRRAPLDSGVGLTPAPQSLSTLDPPLPALPCPVDQSPISAQRGSHTGSPPGSFHTHDNAALPRGSLGEAGAR